MKTIQQTITFKASAQNVYALLTDEALLAEFVGKDVEFDNEVDGEFLMFDGYIHGYNEELQPGKKLIQKMNFAEDGWDEEHYSTCVYEFNEENGNTVLAFTQTEVPDAVAAALESGWHEYFWNPMRDMLAQ